MVGGGRRAGGRGGRVEEEGERCEQATLHTSFTPLLVYCCEREGGKAGVATTFHTYVSVQYLLEMLEVLRVEEVFKVWR